MASLIETNFHHYFQLCSVKISDFNTLYSIFRFLTAFNWIMVVNNQNLVQAMNGSFIKVLA